MKKHSGLAPRLILWLVCLLVGLPWGLLAGPEVRAEALRRPIALALSLDEQHVYVANQRTGSISVVEPARQQVVNEVVVGRRLSALARRPNGQLLATDELGHELLVLSVAGPAVSVAHRLALPPYPVDVALSADGRLATVSSLWSRQVTFVAWRDEEVPEVLGLLELPFAPRCQLLVQGDQRLIVADSFGGRLAVIDVPHRRLLHLRDFPGHNIRGLGVSPDGSMLLVAHQMLNELAHTIRNDVHWGLLMSNDLRWLRLDAILTPDGDIYQGAHMHPLGHAGSATGDPAGLVVTRDGTAVVTLGGVGEVAVGQEDDFSLQRITVGRRPTAVAAGGETGRVYVTHTFGESLGIVDLAARQCVSTIPLGTPAQLSLADRGEELFFDARLSHDRWMSCHSCHTDGHTNGLLNDNFSDASFGAPKRVLSLLGRSETAPFAWNASAATLDEQIRNSIQHTMQADDAPEDEEIAALAAFVATLAPPPSIDRIRGVQDAAAVQRGSRLFTALDCRNCHAPPTYTTPDTYDVGLGDKLGNVRFNPPSLLGVGQRGPYFHDNRAATLADVFREFRHQLGRELSDEELDDLLAFLRSLE